MSGGLWWLEVELARAWIIMPAAWKGLQGHTQAPGQSLALWPEDTRHGLVWFGLEGDLFGLRLAESEKSPCKALRLRALVRKLGHTSHHMTHHAFS